MTRSNANFQSFFLPILFFPSILLFPLGDAEIFPYGILTIFFMKRINRQAKAEYAVLLAVIYGALMGISNNAPLEEFFRSLAAYLNVLIPSIYLLSHRDASENLIQRIPIIFWIMCIIGLLQFSGALPNIIEDIVRIVIPKFNLSVSANNYRGVSLFSTEPSRAGAEFVVVSILYFWFRHNQGKKYVMEFLISIFLILFVIRSGTAALLLIIAFLAFSPLKGGLTLAISAMGIMFVPIDLLGRGIGLIQEVFAQHSMDETYLFLLNESGFRLISNFAAYSSFIQNPFGYGVGQWQTSSVITLDSLGDAATQAAFFRELGGIVSVRPTSLFGQLILDSGILGILASVFFIVSHAVLKQDSFARALFAVFLAITMFFGDAGNPVPWVGLSLMICQNRITKPQVPMRKLSLFALIRPHIIQRKWL